MSVNNKSSQSKKFLSQTSIHVQWESEYLNADLDRFYDLAFADIVGVLEARASDKILDAGCGYCCHTVRLARSGASITAVDFSEAALAVGRQTITQAGIVSQVKLRSRPI